MALVSEIFLLIKFAPLSLKSYSALVIIRVVIIWVSGLQGRNRRMKVEEKVAGKQGDVLVKCSRALGLVECREWGLDII